MQRTFLPFLQIAYHAMPLAVCTRGEVLLILYRRSRFEQEDLNECTLGERILGILAEMKSCPDDSGIIEHHQRPLGQEGRQRTETRMTYLSVTVDQKLTVITYGKGELGNTLVGERIAIIAYLYLFCIHTVRFCLQRYCISGADCP